jgi:hypothetical protein
MPQPGLTVSAGPLCPKLGRVARWSWSNAYLLAPHLERLIEPCWPWNRDHEALYDQLIREKCPPSAQTLYSLLARRLHALF